MAVKEPQEQTDWKSELVRDSLARFEEHVLEPARAQLDSVRADLELRLAAAQGAPDAELRTRMIEADIAALETTRRNAEAYAEMAKGQLMARFEDTLAASV